MISSAPRLRSDLAVRRQQTAKGEIHVIKDPLSGEFYRLGEAEWFITRRLDGETPLDVVRESAEERFGATLRAGTLDAFIRTLDKAGLLEGAAKKRSGRRRRMRGGLLYARAALFDPDRLLGRLAPRLWFFFTPAFVVLSAVVIVLALAATIGNWSTIAQDLAGLYRLSAIPLVLAVAFVVGSAHELAHGLTCKRLGGEVHEIGFMLIYFQPALYCDVSDAWMFPERSKRLWVGFSGPYFEMFLWALATLAWRVTDAATWINSLALIVMTVSGLKTLFNFNPFIKLDGYYLLSDVLDLPNLRSKSFRHVGGLVERLFGVPARRDDGILPGERRVYLFYGLTATVVSFALLGYVLVTTGGFLLEHHQPAALMLFAGAAGLKSRRRIRKLFRRSPGPSDDAEEEDDAGDPDRPAIAAPRPLAATGHAVRPADAAGPGRSPDEVSEPGEPGRRRGGPWRRRLAWAAATGVTLAVLFLGRIELRITGPFSVLPEENADVRPAVEGIVEAIVVEEGDTIGAGAVVARLSNETLLAELHKVAAGITETRADLRRLVTGPTVEEIELAEAGVSKAAGRLEYARGRLAMLRPLHEQGLLSGRDFADLQEQASAAAHELAEAEGRLRLLRRGPRPEEIDATRARL